MHDLNNSFFQWMEEKSTVLEDIDKLDSVIAWWRDPAQKSRFPFLYRMAIDIFSIPAMSSEPEHVFSGTKNTISDNRASLNMETIEATQCLKSWFRSGLLSKTDFGEALRAEVTEV